MASPSTTKTATPTLPPPTGLIPTQPGIIRVDLTPQGNTSPPRAEPSPHTPPCSHPGTQQGLLNEPKTTFNRWLKETARGSRSPPAERSEGLSLPSTEGEHAPSSKAVAFLFLEDCRDCPPLLRPWQPQRRQPSPAASAGHFTCVHPTSPTQICTRRSMPQLAEH